VNRRSIGHDEHLDAEDLDASTTTQREGTAA
jgi:hypothetical protein